MNEYGNYVIQKVLSLAKEDKKFIFFNYIIQVSKKLHTLPFGQKIISKLLIYCFEFILINIINLFKLINKQLKKYLFINKVIYILLIF